MKQQAIKRSDLVNCIAECHKGFKNSWLVLCRMKSGEASAEDILNFQPTLLNCFVLAEKYFLKIKKEKKILIAKKGKLTLTLFVRRMRTLAKYESILLELLSFGKSLGDAFAWIFYYRDRQLLNKHLSRDKVSHLPPGIGGIGEFELIKRVKGIAGHLIIYHGITNILRYGDVSLVNLTSLRIAAIGEIKTARLSDTEISVSLFFYGKKEGTETSAPRNREKSISLPDNLKQKLNRQLNEIVNLYKDSITRWPDKPEIEFKAYYKDLIWLANTCKPIVPEYKKVGDGLLLIGLKQIITNNDPLGLLTKSLDLTTTFQILPEEFKKIQSYVPEDNIIFIRTIDPRLGILPGGLPIFWWPVDNNVLKEIYFGELFVITVYNLAFFIHKLRALGLEVSWDAKKEELNITRRTPERTETIFNNRYFIALIQNWLISEDSIIGLIKTFLEGTKDKVIKPGTRIDMQIIQEIRHVKK